MDLDDIKYQVIVGCCNLYPVNTNRTDTNTKKLGIGIMLNNVPTMAWSFSDDMQHFKNTTTGNFVLMGRLTWDSIPEKFRPLPNRINIIVSSNADKLNEEKYQKYDTNISTINIQGLTNTNKAYDFIHFVKSIEEGFEFYKTKYREQKYMYKELFVIGGEHIYNQIIEKYPNNIDKLFITILDNTYPCNKYFPLEKYMEYNPKLIFETSKKNDTNNLSIFKEQITYHIEVYKFIH